MRKTFTTLIALTTLVALAVPADAAKGAKPGKQSQLDISVAADPGWTIHALGDVIEYTVLVSSDDSDALPPVSMTDTLSTVLTLSGGDTNSDGLLDATETWIYIGKYEVLDLDPDEITNTVYVQFGDLTASASVSVNIFPFESCDFGETGTGTMVVPGDPRDTRWCIWDPPASGGWVITGHLPAGTNKKITKALLIVKDYAPGDLCEGWAGSLRSGQEATIVVDLPEDGDCPGDAGGDGNPQTFYLATQGLGTVTTTPET